MKGIAKSLWNYPSVFAGAVQIANTTLLAEGVLPPAVAIPLATVAAVLHYTAVSPSNPKK